MTRPSSDWRPPDGARHLVGDVLDPAFVRAALAGQDVVLSALGLRRASPAPWSRLLSTIRRADVAGRMLDMADGTRSWTEDTVPLGTR